MTKKLICFLITVICLLTSISSISVLAENSKEEPIAQTVLSDSREEALLNYLGVKSDNSLDLNEEITRGEFARMIAPIVYRNIVENINFDDVTAEHEFFDEISVVAGAYVMTGTSAGKFSPDDKMIYSHALKAVTRMLGLRYVAEAFGEGIDSYKKVLTLAGLKLRLSDTTVLTRHMAYDLIYDSLFTNTLDSVNGIISKGNNTFLKERFDMISIDGQLTDNGVTALNGKSAVGLDHIRLGDTEMKNATTGIEDYLGYFLECYVREEDDEYVLMHFTPSSKNEVVDIYTEDYISSDDSSIAYEKNNRQKTLQFSTDLKVIYNGKFDPTFLRSDFKNVTGKITFLKSKGSSDYDIAFVHDEEIFVVSRVNLAEMKLVNDFDEPLILDENSADVEVMYYYNGEKADFSKITADDVLTIEKSRDKTLYKIYISDTEVSGVPTSLNDEGATVDGNYYEFTDYYLSKVAALEYVKLGMGKKNLIYLDYHGRIVKINAKVLRDTYAWLEGIRFDDGLEDITYVKLYTETGEMKILVAKDKVTFNGTRVDSSFLATSPLLKDGASTIRQLITYRENSKGELTEINTAANMTEVEDYRGYTENQFTYDYYSERSAFRTGVFSSFDFRKYYIAASTVVFIIPTSEGESVDKFAIKTGKYFQNNTVYNGIKVYDAQDNTVPNVIVLYTSEDEAVSSVQDDSSICIFEGTSEKLNEDNEVALVMHAYDGGGEFELEIVDENVCDIDGAYWPQIKNEDGTVQDNQYLGMKLKDLPEGALIQYALDAYGKISDIRILHIDGVTPYETWTMTRGSSGSTTLSNTMTRYVNNNFFQYGLVEGIHSGIMVYSINGVNYPISHSNTRNIVIFDKSGRSQYRIRMGTGDDIEPGDKVFIKTAWANLNFMFCIKE